MSNASPAHADANQPSTSNMNFGDLTYVRKVGSALGIVPDQLPKEAVQEVNNNVTYLLRNVIAGSQRFAFHARRTRILPEDIDSHLQLERKPALFGFKPRELIALRLPGSGGKEVYVDEDKEIELTALYTSTVSKIPALPFIKSHWLAIDGEQPAVPDNPVPKPKEPSYGQADASQNVDDAQEEANRLLNIVRGTKVNEQVNVKTTTTHTLSLEQQIYYKEITEAIMGACDIKRKEALLSLRTDTGLQPLLSRFSIAVAEGVRCNIVQHNLAFLIYLMRTVQALHENPSVSLDKCLHELMPSLISCIVSRQVCSRPESDNHWALREFAGKLIVDMCRKHHTMDVQTRVIDVMQNVWTRPSSNLSTMYGALYTLHHFGPETVRCIVVPHLPVLYSRIQAVVNERADAGERVAADRILGFVHKVMVDFVRRMRPSNLNSYEDYVTMFSGFADAVYRSVGADMHQRAQANRPQNSQRPPGQQPQHVQRIVPRQSTGSGYSTPVQSRSGTPVSRQVISNGPQVRYTTTSTPANVVRRPVTNQPPNGSRPSAQ